MLPVSEESIQAGSKSSNGTGAGVRISGGLHPFVYAFIPHGCNCFMGLGIEPLPSQFSQHISSWGMHPLCTLLPH